LYGILGFSNRKQLFAHNSPNILTITIFYDFQLILAVFYTLFIFIYYLHNCPFPFEEEITEETLNLSYFNKDNSEILDTPISSEFTIPFTSYVFTIKSRSGSTETDIEEEIRNCRPWRSVHIMGTFVLFFTLVQLFVLGWKLFFKPKHSLTSSKWWCWTIFAICAITTLYVPVFWNHDNHDIYAVFYPMASVSLGLWNIHYIIALVVKTSLRR